jgi:hypothetical protein
MNPNRCYVCNRKKPSSIADLGMCKLCYQSFTRTDGAGSNIVAAMAWAVKRARATLGKCASVTQKPAP